MRPRLIGVAQPSLAANISISASSTGKNLELFRKQLDAFEKATGNKVSIVTMPSSSTDQFSQYRLWLAAGNKDVDVYQTDVIWAPQLADQFVDLKDAAKDVVGDFFPSIIASQTVNGRLRRACRSTPMHRPCSTARTCSDKYGKQPPKTWDEMAATAKEIQEKERGAGQKDLWGFVFQGNAYEGLTCNALEWVKSSGGGQIVEAGRHHLHQQREGRSRASTAPRAGSERSPRLACWPIRKKSPAASGRPATPSSCATGPMPTRSAMAPTAPSRASST